MIYVHPLTAAEVEALRAMMRHDIGRVSQRAHLILLSAQHTSIPDLARLFAWSQPTVRFWIRRFEVAGPDGLRDAPRSGRPRKVTPAAEANLSTFLQQDPQRIDQTFLATCWTTAMLVLLCTTRLHITVARSTLRSALQRLGLRWRRPRLAMPRTPDPQKAAKQWQLAAAVVAAPPDTAIIYADESRIQTLPLVRAMWQQRGQHVRIPTPGTNHTITIFGALNIRTGRWDYILRNRMQADDFLLFLTYLLGCYRDHSIIVIVDNYSSHTAHKVMNWVADEPRLHLLFLPTHCAHLNPVERIWLQLKNTIAPNRLYGSIEVLRQMVFTFFRAMTPEQARHWAAVEM
ncbi:MAG TPA: IS630 family transposase [Herpetosiphonaceae bacterium]